MCSGLPVWAGPCPELVSEVEVEKSDRLLRIGVIGLIVTAVCCFTPVLVLLLGTVGLSALVGGLDYVLLPALAMFAGLAGYALWRRRTS